MIYKESFMIQKNKLIAILIYIIHMIVLITSCFIVKINTFEQWTNMIVFFILLSLVIQIVINNYLNISLISITSYFIFLSYLFQFGHIFLYFIDYKFTVQSIDYKSVYSVNTIIKATQYSLFAINFVYLGVLLGVKGSRKYIKNSKVIDKKIYKLSGFIIFIPTLILNLYLLIYRIRLVNIYGSYAILLDSNVPSIINTISKFMYVGIFLLMIYFKKTDNIKYSRLIWLIGLLVAFTSLFTGARSAGMAELFLLIYLYSGFIERFSRKQWLYLILSSIFLLGILSAIRNTRNSGISFSSVLTSVNLQENNIILETLDEFGLSLYTLTAIINKGPFERDYLQIIYKEIVSAIPLLNDIFVDISTPVIKKLDIFNLGATYIADIYFYLNNFGFLMFMFLGYYIKRIEGYIEKLKINEQYYKIAGFIVWMLVMLSSIRSSFTLGLKVMLLSFIGLFTMKHILLIGRSKR